MPRATSEKFSRLHQSAAKSSKTPSSLNLNGASRSKHTGRTDGYGGGGTSTNNPLFNTERFGQHILKNPLVAQAQVHYRPSKTIFTYLFFSSQYCRQGTPHRVHTRPKIQSFRPISNQRILCQKWDQEPEISRFEYQKRQSTLQQSRQIQGWLPN